MSWYIPADSLSVGRNPRKTAHMEKKSVILKKRFMYFGLGRIWPPKNHQWNYMIKFELRKCFYPESNFDFSFFLLWKEHGMIKKYVNEQNTLKEEEVLSILSLRILLIHSCMYLS